MVDIQEVEEEDDELTGEHVDIIKRLDILEARARAELNSRVTVYTCEDYPQDFLKGLVPGGFSETIDLYAFPPPLKRDGRNPEGYYPGGSNPVDMGEE